MLQHEGLQVPVLMVDTWVISSTYVEVDAHSTAEIQQSVAVSVAISPANRALPAPLSFFLTAVNTSSPLA